MRSAARSAGRRALHVLANALDWHCKRAAGTLLKPKAAAPGSVNAIIASVSIPHPIAAAVWRDVIVLLHSQLVFSSVLGPPMPHKARRASHGPPRRSLHAYHVTSEPTYFVIKLLFFRKYIHFVPNISK